MWRFQDRPIAWACFVFHMMWVIPGCTHATGLREHLLVVFNSADASSTALAREYAEARGIPPERVLGIPTPMAETITRTEFNRNLRDPIVSHLAKREWMIRQPARIKINGESISTQQSVGNQIWAIVLMRGIPLRIENDPTVMAPSNLNEPLRTNAASVDSELALLPLENYPLSGLIPNPYYHENRVREFNQYLADNFIMVTRLDGPTADDVRRMFRDAIEVEKMELSGRAFFDTRGLSDPTNPYSVGDDWIRQAQSVCQAGGFDGQRDDNGPVYGEKEPWEDVAIYAGWYENHVTGPFNTPGFRFAPGAVAYHLHSFSGESVRSKDRFWVGPLIDRGAAATMGNVYEPYLRMTPNVGVFFRALLDGLTFAEAGYQSQVGLSWMTTFVGDPLYRPFPRPFLESMRIAESRQDRAADWMLAKTLRLLARQEGITGEKIATLLRAAESRPTPIIWEECGDLLEELQASPETIGDCYAKARRGDVSGITNMRLGLKQAGLLQAKGDTQQTMEWYEKLLADDPTLAVRYGLPEKAILYASSAGWSKFSQAMRVYLAPVGNAPTPPPPNNTHTVPPQPPQTLNNGPSLMPATPSIAPTPSSPTKTFKPSIP